jgi:hypothetical protein
VYYEATPSWPSACKVQNYATRNWLHTHRRGPLCKRGAALRRRRPGGPICLLDDQAFAQCGTLAGHCWRRRDAGPPCSGEFPQDVLSIQRRLASRNMKRCQNLGAHVVSFSSSSRPTRPSQRSRILGCLVRLRWPL